MSCVVSWITEMHKALFLPEQSSIIYRIDLLWMMHLEDAINTSFSEHGSDYKVREMAKLDNTFLGFNS